MSRWIIASPNQQLLMIWEREWTQYFPNGLNDWRKHLCDSLRCQIMNRSSLSQTYILGRVSWTITKRLMLLTYVIPILSCHVGLKGDVAVYYSPPYEQKKSSNGLPLYNKWIQWVSCSHCPGAFRSYNMEAIRLKQGGTLITFSLCI